MLFFREKCSKTIRFANLIVIFIKLNKYYLIINLFVFDWFYYEVEPLTFFNYTFIDPKSFLQGNTQ